MAFLLGLVLGLAAGIALIIAFVQLENSRSKKRSELAATIAAFSRMTVEDSRKILPAKHYPSWVVFAQSQKLNWLNLQLTKIWPYVDQAASEVIKSSVEPVLEQYRPVVLSSLKFSKLTLGTIAPQFTGVSIVEADDSGITMELEMQWDGNPNIVLEVQTYLGVALPIQVKNIGFTGVFRLIFKPLVDQLPCFGAVSYSLREKKKLDFTLKVVGGEISSIPGISDAIEETLHDAIEDSLVWPVRKIVPIIPGDYSYLELKPVGTLEVKLIQAKNLSNKDIVGKSDPYAVLYIRPIHDRMKRSKTINNDLNPIWNEHFEFIVEDASTQRFIVKIYDDEGVQASELIGCAQVLLKDLQPGKVKDVWLKLVKDLEIQRDKKDRGQVHLELLYCPFGTENEFTNPFANQDFSMTSLEKALKSEASETDVTDIDKMSKHKKKDAIVRGVLTVTVISAQDLPSMDVLGKADPYVVLSMKKTETKNKTRVVSDNLNPTWNQTFDFVVEDGLHDMLILEVWDHDTFGKNFIGKCIMTLTRVILEGEFTDSFILDGAKSGKLNLHLKWVPQPIYRNP
ncbi:Enolase-like N-terminal protein [Dioscorea alata]|uniref:Enolase-like N-terminal protein n=1 Tax=Dioscorea alata TaxID=55571 RepID=A0ACB7VDK5_DIOAL|nr:Enolase-like N-terminal protein [Dioscorea alata]